jgi:hypothetical protein
MNALVTLGTQYATSLSEDTPPNPLDGAEDPPPLPAETPAPAAGTLVGTGAVRINNSPTHEHPSNTNKPTQPVHPPQSILCKPTNALQQQLNDSSSNNTKLSIDSLIDGNRQGHLRQVQQAVEGDDGWTPHGVPR